MDDNIFTIDKNVQILPYMSTRSAKYVRTAMRMTSGDSVQFSSRKEAAKLRRALTKVHKYGVLRTTENGFRVWCLEKPKSNRVGRPPKQGKEGIDEL